MPAAPKPAPKKVTLAQLQARVNYWRQRMWLTEWAIKVELAKLPKNEASKIEAGGECDAMPEYRQAVLRFDPANIEPDQIDEFVVHELTHLTTWRLAYVAEVCAGKDKRLMEWIRMEDEGLTTHIERVIRYLDHLANAKGKDGST